MSGYMTTYHKQLHGTNPEIDLDQLTVRQTEHLPLVYEVIFQTNMHLCQCLFPGCPGTSHSRNGLQNHLSRF